MGLGHKFGSLSPIANVFGSGFRIRNLPACPHLNKELKDPRSHHPAFGSVTFPPVFLVQLCFPHCCRCVWSYMPLFSPMILIFTYDLISMLSFFSQFSLPTDSASCFLSCLLFYRRNPVMYIPQSAPVFQMYSTRFFGSPCARF